MLSQKHLLWLLIPILLLGIFFASPNLSQYFHASISTTQQTTISPSEISLEASSKGIFTVQMKNFSGNPVKISLTADDASKVMIFPNKRTIKTNKKYLFFVFTDGEFNTDTTVRVKNESGEEMASVMVKKKVSTSPVQNPRCVDPGQGFWEVPSECLPAGHARVRVKDARTAFSDPVPGPDNFHGTFQGDEIWALRHIYAESSVGHYISIYRAEGGETTMAYKTAFSRIPGSFTQTINENGNIAPLPASCFFSPIVQRDMYVAQRGTHSIEEYCPLDSRKFYYFNIQAGDTSCGNGKECRMRSENNIPHASPYPQNPFPAGYATSTSDPEPVNQNCTDPGTEKWDVPSECWPDEEKVMVKQGIESGNSYLPLGDRYHGSMNDNEVWSLRHFFSEGQSLYRITIDTAEGGESQASFDVTLSRIPGEFSFTLDATGSRQAIPSACKLENAQLKTIYAVDRETIESLVTTNIPYCPLDPGQNHYLNVRVHGAQGCGIGDKAAVGTKGCRLKSFSNIPH